jgi:hypothetical protein
MIADARLLDNSVAVESPSQTPTRTRYLPERLYMNVQMSMTGSQGPGTQDSCTQRMPEWPHDLQIYDEVQIVAPCWSSANVHPINQLRSSCTSAEKIPSRGIAQTLHIQHQVEVVE